MATMSTRRQSSKSPTVAPDQIGPFTAVVKREGRWWIGWIAEVPGVNCQEATRTALLASLAETLREILDLNRADARASAGEGFSEIKLSI